MTDSDRNNLSAPKPEDEHFEAQRYYSPRERKKHDPSRPLAKALINKFADQVRSGVGADLETQQLILELLEVNRSRLNAKTGRRANLSRDVYMATLAAGYRAQGRKMQSIHEDLAAQFHLSVERVKSILQKTHPQITGCF